MRRAFAEANLYSMRDAKGEFKVLMAKQNGVTLKESSKSSWRSRTA